MKLSHSCLLLILICSASNLNLNEEHSNKLIIENDVKTSEPIYMDLSSENIYKFYFPVEYYLTGNIYLAFNSTNYIFNSSVYLYSKRRSTTYNKKTTLNFTEIKEYPGYELLDPEQWKQLQGFMTILKARYSVDDDDTQYLAFEIDPIDTINNTEIFIGNGMFLDVTYYLKNGDSDYCSFYNMYYYYIYLETKKSQIGEIQINIQYRSKTFSQKVTFYECESYSWQTCNKTKNSYFNQINDDQKNLTYLKLSYAPTDITTTYILFKFKPVFSSSGRIYPTVKDNKNEHEKGGKSINTVILIFLIVVPSLIIIAIAIFILYKFYFQKSQQKNNTKNNLDSPLYPAQ